MREYTYQLNGAGDLFRIGMKPPRKGAGKEAFVKPWTQLTIRQRIIVVRSYVDALWDNSRIFQWTVLVLAGMVGSALYLGIDKVARMITGY